MAISQRRRGAIAGGRRGTAYNVPTSIVHDGITPADVAITAFIATVPDGKTIRFPSGFVYGQTASITVNDRANLTIDGNGSRFKAVGAGPKYRQQWLVQGGSNINLSNMIIEGVFPPGAASGAGRVGYDVRMDGQSAVEYGNVTGGTVTDITTLNTYGDPVTIGYDRRDPVGACSPYCTDITVTRLNATNSGRTVAVIAGERIIIEDATIDQMHDSGIDLETDWDCTAGVGSALIDITIRRCTISNWWFAAIAHTGLDHGAKAGQINILDNVLVGDPQTCWPAIFAVPHDDTGPRGPYIITGNTFISMGNGVDIARLTAAGSRIEHNTFTKINANLCGSGPGQAWYLAQLTNCSNINIYGNTTLFENPPDDYYTAVYGGTGNTNITTLSELGETTTTYKVAADGDDGHSDFDASPGTDFNLGGFVAVGHQFLSVANIHSFMRFTNVTVPQGATIVSAILDLTAWSMDTTIPATTFQGYDADNGAAPTNHATFATAVAATTSATVAWTPTTWTGGGTVHYQTPNLAPIVQEIVDRAGWASGNALTLVWRPTSAAWPGATQFINAIDHNNGGTSVIPALTVIWS